MSAAEKPKPPALDNMWNVDDIVAPDAPTPTLEQRETMARSAEKLGFTSREVPAPKAPVPRAPAQYPARLSARVRDEDKQRFEDLAYRLRMPAGEALKYLLDLEEGNRDAAN